MFKFNFDVDGSAESNCSPFKHIEEEPNKRADCLNIKPDIDWYKAEQVKSTERLLNNLDIYELNAKKLKVGSTELQHLIAGFILDDIKTHSDVDSQDIKKSEESHSDLITGVYEGGAKIWECTDDLLVYLVENYTETHWQNKRVLDLGCGSGLLGIYALKNGAKVDFQDYNKDVLEQITLPNVLLNLKDTLTDAEKIHELNSQTKFYAGDWSHFASLTENLEKYDIILTSETIYNIENQQKLLDTFGKRLAVNGIVLVAAKSHYFGVGGGLEQFMDVVKRHGLFKNENVWQAKENLRRVSPKLKSALNLKHAVTYHAQVLGYTRASDFVVATNECKSLVR